APRQRGGRRRAPTRRRGWRRRWPGCPAGGGRRRSWPRHRSTPGGPPAASRPGSPVLPTSSAMPLHTERDGTGPRIVLVHGFTQTGRCWSPVDEDLAADHEVVRVDAPGHGGSSEVRAGLPDGARLIGDAGGLATYVGYSMGARFLLHLGLLAPSRVR